MKCSKCLVGPTWDTAEIESDGVCNICKQIEIKNNIDWPARKIMLHELAAKAKAAAIERGDPYDCALPVSGSKDSAYTAWYVVNELGLKPLLLRYDHGLYRPHMNENFKRMTKILGVDVNTFELSFKVVREIMLEGLKRRGDSCVSCHNGVYSSTMQQVVRYKIPLVIWGEPIQEYASYGSGLSYEDFEQVDETRFNRVASLGMTAEDLFYMLDGRVSKRDLAPFEYPAPEVLKKMRLQSICLGSYIPWNVKEQVKIIEKELAWEGAYTENIPYFYEKSECQMSAVRDWCRWLKRGHSRATHLANIEIRHGRMTREEAVEFEEVNQPKRPESLDHFLKMWHLTEAEFEEIVLSHKVGDHNFPRANEKAPAPKDMPTWDATDVPWPNHPGAKLPGGRAKL